MILLEVTNYTWTVTLVGLGIVFSVMMLLAIIFSFLPKLIHIKFDFKSLKKGNIEEAIERKEIVMTADEVTAIAMALSMYFDDLHENESNVITIKEIQKRYSPWSSKLFGMNNVVFMNSHKAIKK